MSVSRGGMSPSKPAGGADEPRRLAQVAAGRLAARWSGCRRWPEASLAVPSVFQLIEIIVRLESIIPWVEDAVVLFPQRLGGVVVALNPPTDLRPQLGWHGQLGMPSTNRSTGGFATDWTDANAWRGGHVHGLA